MPRNHKLLLAALLCAAFLLRTAGLRSGLPSETGRLATFHPDESITFYSLERMKPAERDFFPGDSLYWGTFLVYAQGAVAKALQLTGAVKLGGRDYLLAHLGEVDKLYISGRLLAAVFATASVLVLFFVARRLLGVRGAFFAAAFFAFFYVNAWMASILKPDGIMLFWGLLAFNASLDIVETGRRRDYLQAGAFVGLSAVSKYTGVVFALPVAFAWAARAGGPRKAARTFPLALAAAFAAAAAYAAVNPYVLLRFADVLPYLQEVAGKGAWPADPLSGYAEYLLYLLPAAAGWPLFLFSLAGFFRLASLRTAGALSAVIFSAVYFLKFGAPPEQAFTYSLPLTPFMALAAGALAENIFDRPRGKALALGALAYTLAYAVFLQGLFLRPSTMTRAGEWIASNVPAGAAIAISKNDTWIPPEIRRDAAPYRVLAGGTPQGPLSEAIIGLEGAAAGAEYLVLSDIEDFQAERDREAGRPGAALALERIRSGFDEAAVFSFALPRFFLPLTRPREEVQLKLTQTTVRILRKKEAAGR